MEEKVIGLFPEEIVRHIFSFLNVKDLLRLRLVSEGCKRISEDVIFSLFDRPKDVEDQHRWIKFYCFLQSVDQDIRCKVFKNFTFFILMQLPNIFGAFFKHHRDRRVFGDHLFASSSNFFLVEDLQLEESLLNDEVENSLFFKQKILKIEKYETGNSTFNLSFDINKIYYFYSEFLFLQSAYYSLNPKEQASMIFNYLKKKAPSVCHVEFSKNDLAGIGFVKYEDLQLTFRLPQYDRTDTLENLFRDSFQISAPYRYIAMGYHRDYPNKLHVDRLSFEAYGLEKVVSYKSNKELLIKKINAESKRNILKPKSVVFSEYAVFGGKKVHFLITIKRKLGLEFF